VPSDEAGQLVAREHNEQGYESRGEVGPSIHSTLSCARPTSAITSLMTRPSNSPANAQAFPLGAVPRGTQADKEVITQ
jgi:hypothetical protein